MLRQTALLLLVTLAMPMAAGGFASEHERDVTALAAMPTPFGPLSLLRDDASWQLDVPEGAVVRVEARADPTTPFHLRWHRVDAPEPGFGAPSTARAVTLPGGAWRVVADPAAGVDVRIHLTFTGCAVDCFLDRPNAPVPFMLTDEPRPRGCVAPGACLP